MCGSEGVVHINMTQGRHVARQVIIIGLLTFGKKSLLERRKIWPLYLIYLSLPLDELGFSPLIIYRDGEESHEVDPKEELKRYLHYYNEALIQPSPYYPDLVKALKEKTTSPLELLKRKTSDQHCLWLTSQGTKSGLVLHKK